MIDFLFIVIGLICIFIIYRVYRRKLKEYFSQETTYDLVIQFDENYYIDIRDDECMKSIGKWRKCGRKSFKGYSVLDKEGIEEILSKNHHLKENQFKVYRATHLFFINK